MHDDASRAGLVRRESFAGCLLAARFRTTGTPKAGDFTAIAIDSFRGGGSGYVPVASPMSLASGGATTTGTAAADDNLVTRLAPTTALVLGLVEPVAGRPELARFSFSAAQVADPYLLDLASRQLGARELVPFETVDATISVTPNRLNDSDTVQ